MTIKAEILDLAAIGSMQLEQGEAIDVRYTWCLNTDTLEPRLKGVRIVFRQPNPELWKRLMTCDTRGFLIDIAGTRNGNHDSLDPCYRALIVEVNEVRKHLGQEPVFA